MILAPQSLRRALKAFAAVLLVVQIGCGDRAVTTEAAEAPQSIFVFVSASADTVSMSTIEPIHVASVGAAASTAARYTVSPTISTVDGAVAGKATFEVKCDRKASSCEKFKLSSDQVWPRSSAFGTTYQGTKSFTFTFTANPSSTEYRQAYISIIVHRDGRDVSVGRMEIRQRPSPVAPPEVSPVQVAQGGPAAPGMLIGLGLSEAVRETNVVVEFGTTLVDGVVSDDRRGVTVLVPEVAAGSMRLRLLSTGSKELARGTITISASVPQIEQLGAKRLALLGALVDSLKLMPAAIKANIGPNTLDLSPLVATAVSAVGQIGNTIGVIRAEGSVETVRALGSLPASVDETLNRVAASVGSVRAELIAASLSARIAASTRSYTSRVTSTSSMSACEAAVRELDGALAQATEYLQRVLGWLPIVNGIATGAAMRSRNPWALAIAATLEATTIIAALTWAIMDATNLIQQLKPDLWVPAPPPNSYALFLPAAVRPGDGGSFTTMAQYTPLAARGDKVLSRLSALLSVVNQIRTRLKSLEDIGEAISGPMLERLFGKDNLRIQFAAKLTDLADKIEKVMNDLRRFTLVRSARPLQLGNGVTISPLKAPDNSWTITPATQGGTFTTTKQAARQTVNVTVGGTSTDPAAASVCEFTSLPPDDEGQNRFRILAPDSRVYLTVKAQASQTGDYLRVVSEQLSDGDSFARSSIAARVNKNDDPTRIGFASISGQLDSGSFSATVESSADLKHNGGALWAWYSLNTSTTLTVYARDVQPGETVWLVAQGTPQVQTPSNATIHVNLSGKNIPIAQASFADSVKLAQLTGPAIVVDGTTYQPFGTMSATTSAGYATTCIIAACGPPPFFMHSIALLKYQVRVAIRKPGS